MEAVLIFSGFLIAIGLKGWEMYKEGDRIKARIEKQKADIQPRYKK